MKNCIKAFVIFNFLLFAGIHIHAQSSYEYSGDLSIRLLEAASNGDYPVVADCLKKGVDVNTETWEGVNALMYATTSGNRLLVRLLLDKGAKVNEQPYNGYTALMTASQYGFTDIAEMLLADSAKVDFTDSHKATALHYASLYNNDTIVFMLLGAGADPDALTTDHVSPLAMAAINGSYEAAYLLIDAGANVNLPDKYGFTPLMLASQNGSMPLAELLVNNNANAKLQNNRGFSALSLSILNKHEDIVKLLLANGANAKESNSISINAKALAKISGDSAIIAAVKKAGAKNNYFPTFKTMGAGIELEFNSHDLMSGFFITQSDLKYKLNYNLGFSFRPSAIKVDFKIPDVGYYQFMERRYMFNLDLAKEFSFNSGNNSVLGVNIGGRFLYTFGKYRGTNIPINGGFKAAPQAWFFLRNHDFEARLGYHYSNYGEKELDKSHFTINLIYHFYNFNTFNINRKLKWIE